MTKRTSIYITVYIMFCACMNHNDSKCIKETEISNLEILRGNTYYNHEANYSKAIEYLVFKKYGFIDYLEYYPSTTDSCFCVIMNKEIESKIGKKKRFLDQETKSYKKSEETTGFTTKNSNLKFIDSVFVPFDNVKYPIMKYPMKEKNFKEFLVNHIIKKIDSSYDSSSFWIVVNNKGKVEKIERYKKHSKEVDDYIEEKLRITQWLPSMNNADSTFVSTRIIFKIKR